MENRKVAVDLRLNRRESGLSNEDVAHLLDVDKARVSRLENGKAEPNVTELCTLFLIYGKAFNGLLPQTVEEAAQKLKLRLPDMPQEPEHWRATAKRHETLDTLLFRLRALNKQSYGA